jgi:hypothetical protein
MPALRSTFSAARRGDSRPHTAVVIAVCFGFYPARKAAQLAPDRCAEARVADRLSGPR